MEQINNLHQNTESTYEDDYVLITFTKGWGEPHCVLAGATGKAKAICVSSNFFSPRDILEAYEEVLDAQTWGMEAEEVASHLQDCKDWLIRTGCPAEELE